jgi:hypothetical protein
MPLLRIDLIEGWTDTEIETLLDTAHGAVVDAFAVPERDRYQIVQVHPARRVVLQDTGLGFERSGRAVLVQVTSRRRSETQKATFYRLLQDRLIERCGLASHDLLVTIVENGDADWSFGHGEAQFLTGALT